MKLHVGHIASNSLSLLSTLLGRFCGRDELHTGVEDLQAVHLSELVRVPGKH